ncbi:autotransporter domain-containing protein [Burkholderia ubonensis]|uniref:autotransporter domain-containing protein n=1 Tax=Burkholderia ubonensis TaxID=101571 RepID=UPI000ADF95AE|nr:autotransporter domain-containing protein [Burkholderia ubonensis]
MAALAQSDLGVGTLQVNAYNLGGYWAHIGPGGWYTDAVVMGSALTVRTHSNDNVSGATDGARSRARWKPAPRLRSAKGRRGSLRRNGCGNGYRLAASTTACWMLR